MSALHDQLHALAAHVRDAATHAGPPGIEDRRLAVYRELVFNNLDGLLAGTFPVIRRTLGDTGWQALLRRFLAHHRSETPLFTRLGLELVHVGQHVPQVPAAPRQADAVVCKRRAVRFKGCKFTSDGALGRHVVVNVYMV